MKLSAKEQIRLKSKYGEWAVVTGATSGIGLELAERLAEAGIHLLINARNEQKLQQLKQRFETTYQINVITVAADAGIQEGIEKIIEASKELPAGLFIACAGYGTSGLFTQSNLETERDMLHVNCEGVLMLTHHFAQRFAKQQRGGIILMSSLVAFQGVPYAAHYAATKAYIQSLAEALAVELKPFHVDVLSAAPGPVKSGFEARANMEMQLFATPQQIGIPILKALGRKELILPGLISKFLNWSLRTVPRYFKVRIMKIVMGGMTKHQRPNEK